MHACDFIPFQWPRKEKKEKASKDLYIRIPWAILLHKISTIPTYIAKMLFKVLYMCHVFAFKIILIFIVQFKAHGKVAVYGRVHLCKLHVCHFCGDPSLPPGISVMHPIHDPRKTVMNPHNRVGIQSTTSITYRI
jgi:hypothetical protein